MADLSESKLQDLLRQYGFTIQDHQLPDRKKENVRSVVFLEKDYRRIMTFECPYRESKEQLARAYDIVEQWNKCMNANNQPFSFKIESYVLYVPIYFHEQLKTMSFDEFNKEINHILQVLLEYVCDDCKLMRFIDSLSENEELFNDSRQFLVQLFSDLDHGPLSESLDEVYKEHTMPAVCVYGIELYYLKTLESKYPNIIPHILKL